MHPCHGQIIPHQLAASGELELATDTRVDRRADRRERRTSGPPTGRPITAGPIRNHSCRQDTPTDRGICAPEMRPRRPTPTDSGWYSSTPRTGLDLVERHILVFVGSARQALEPTLNQRVGGSIPSRRTTHAQVSKALTCAFSFYGVSHSIF
jgi:hypothetical protein